MLYAHRFGCHCHLVLLEIELNQLEISAVQIAPVIKLQDFDHINIVYKSNASPTTIVIMFRCCCCVLSWNQLNILHERRSHTFWSIANHFEHNFRACVTSMACSVCVCVCRSFIGFYWTPFENTFFGAALCKQYLHRFVCICTVAIHLRCLHMDLWIVHCVQFRWFAFFLSQIWLWA